MRLKDIIQNSNPTQAFAYDTTTAKFVNLLGSGNAGPTTTPTTVTAVTFNGPQGALLTSSNTIAVAFPEAANSTKTTVPYTLEIAGYPLTVGGMVNRGLDGIFWTGSAFEFRISFASGVQTLSYTTPAKNVHLVAVYNINTMTLYANGVDVASKDITGHTNMTETTTTWTFPPVNVILSAVAFYRRALSGTEAQQHWIEPKVNAYSSQFQSTRWTMSNNDRKIVADKTWQAEDWAAGLFTSGTVNGTAMTLDSGTWTGVLPATGDQATEVKLEWDGSATAQTYLTVSTPTSIADNGVATLVAASTLPVKTVLSFTNIDKFRTTAYEDRVLYSTTSTRTINMDSGVITSDSNHPLSGDGSKNLYIPATKVVSVQTDTGGTYALNTQTIEAWVRCASATNLTTIFSSATTGWVNGVSATQVPAGVWCHVVVGRTNNNVAFNINGEVWISHLAVYPNALVIADAQNLYNSWIATPRLTRKEAFFGVTDVGSVPYDTTVTDDGAVNYWKWNDASGSTVVDSIGGNNLTITSGTATRNAAAISIGLGASTSMLADGVQGTGSTLPSSLANWTLEQWLYPTQDMGGIVSLGNFFGILQIECFFGNFNIGITGATTVSTVWQPPQNAVTHLVITATPTQLYAYANGVQISAGSITGASPLGNYPRIPLTDRPWAGRISNVALYPTALSPTRVGVHYTAGTTIPSGNPGPHTKIYTSVWSPVAT